MRKIIAAICAFFTLTISALAEYSSFFIGGQMNVGAMTSNTQGEYTRSGIFGTTYYRGLGKETAAFYGLGALLGFKLFFTERFGIRIYADGNGNMFFQKEDSEFATSNTPSARFFTRVGANVDILINYLDRPNYSQGLFVGANYTQVSWDANAAKSPWSFNNKKTSGGMGMNVGWRMKNNANNIEFGAMIPFYDETLLHIGPNGQSLSLKENFSIFIRYIRDFDF